MDKTKTTISAYNKNVNAYTDKFMSYEPYYKHVAEFAKLLPDGSKVLDLGCGPGNVARQLLEEKSILLTGIDLSDEMVRLACLNVSGGIFYTQDIRDVHFPADCFDSVVMSFCIVHLSDEEAYNVICNAIRWLIPGGFLYLSFMEGKKPGFETTSFSQEQIYFNYYNGKVIENFLSENGLTVIRTVRQDYPEPDGSFTTDVFLFGQKDKFVL